MARKERGADFSQEGWHCPSLNRPAGVSSSPLAVWSPGEPVSLRIGIGARQEPPPASGLASGAVSGFSPAREASLRQ